MLKQKLSRAGIYLVLFTLFALINIVGSLLLFSKRHQVISTQKILGEIGKSYNAHTQFENSAAPFVLGTYTSKIQIGDGRTSNLKVFFRKYNSPLYNSAETIVEVSDKYGFDYRLIPAIAMQESNLCTYIPEDSYNCWGWGIYGSTVTKFDSYDEAIETVAKGLKTHYIDKGLITASAIMQKYTPSSNGSWAHGVNTFLKALQ